MNESLLARLFEHNRWANRRLLEACASLPDETLDAPEEGSPWTIRSVLLHLAKAQNNYVGLLTGAPDEERERPVPAGELMEHAERSGERLRELARDPEGPHFRERVHVSDGYVFEPWVAMVQAINHATDHRRQVCAMMRRLGVTPPRLDGWEFGKETGALVPPRA